MIARVPGRKVSTWTYTPAEVEEIHHFLRGIDQESIRERFDPEAMDELSIYPFDWTVQSEEKLDRLLACYSMLRVFIGHAANNKLGIVCQLG